MRQKQHESREHSRWLVDGWRSDDEWDSIQVYDVSSIDEAVAAARKQGIQEIDRVVELDPVYWEA